MLRPLSTLLDGSFLFRYVVTEFPGTSLDLTGETLALDTSLCRSTPSPTGSLLLSFSLTPLTFVCVLPYYGDIFIQ